MNFPLELWREISLYLPHNFFSFNKKLSIIYDQSWFRDIVLLSHPNCKKHNSWEHLYWRMMKSGTMRFLDDSGPNYKIVSDVIKINKFYYPPNFYVFALTFDGDLFSHHIINGEIKLVDSNVKDIAKYSYIKENEFYIINADLSTKLIETSESPFLTITDGNDDGDEMVAMITANNFYLYSLELGNLKKFKCENNKNLVYSGAFLIQNIDGVVFSYDRYYDLVELDVPSVKEISSYTAKLFDDTLIILAIEYEDDEELELEHQVLTTKTILKTNNELIGSAYFNKQYFIIINNVLYRFCIDNSTLEFVRDKVKNICNDGYLVI